MIAKKFAIHEIRGFLFCRENIFYNLQKIWDDFEIFLRNFYQN